MESVDLDQFAGEGGCAFILCRFGGLPVAYRFLGIEDNRSGFIIRVRKDDKAAAAGAVDGGDAPGALADPVETVQVCGQPDLGLAFSGEVGRAFPGLDTSAEKLGAIAVFPEAACSAGGVLKLA